MSSIAHSLVAQLRRRISDERVGRVAFRLACVDRTATDCMVAISAAKVLTTTVLNASVAQALTVDLTATAYQTVKQLIEHLKVQAGYEVLTETDYEPRHPSVDLEMVGSISIVGEALTFKHHIFSDFELLEITAEACRRHNVSYTPQTVPRNEENFVVTLAHIAVCRQLASDAAKRRGIETSVDQLLQVARDLEESYDRDMKRQQRAIPVPTFDEAATRQGDIVVGTSSRRSLRSGFYAPMADAGVLQSSKLLDPKPDDVEDTKVLVRWTRNVDCRFYAYELWRDTVPEVERPGGLTFVPHGPQMLREQVKRPFTSKLVFRSFGPNSNKDNVGWATFVEQAGQLITEFVDVGAGDQADMARGDGAMTAPPVEPDSVYYYKLFIVTLNYEVVGSNVVSVKTKALRALMAKTNPITPKEAVAGTLITMTGERFTAGMSVTIGGKAVGALTIISPTQVTFTVPTFNNPAAKNMLYDVVVVSPSTGLKDVFAQGFKYLG